MAVSEKTIQEALQELLLTLNRLEGRPVVINDWDVIKTVSRDDTPLAIIENSDELESRQDTLTVSNNFVIKLTLVGAYLDDKASHDDFRDLRQEVLDGLVGAERSAGGLAAIDIAHISAATPVSYIYDQYVEPDELDTVLPVFIYQTLLLHCEEF